MAKRFNTKDEALAAIDSMSFAQIREMLADYMMQDNTERKIVITEEQFSAFFKIKGIAEDGTAERRGRPRSSKEII